MKNVDFARLRSAMAAVLFFLATMHSRAAPITWFGGTGDWDEPTNWIPNGVPNATSDVVITSGSVQLAGNPTVASFYQNGGTVWGSSELMVSGNLTLLAGTLGNLGDVNVGGDFQWEGGAIGWPGAINTYFFTVNGETTLAGNDHLIVEKVMELAGGGTWTNGNLTLDGATLQVLAGQTFNIEAAENLDLENGSSNGLFENFGTVVKSGSVATSLDIHCYFQNLSETVINSGHLFLFGDGYYTGSFAVNNSTSSNSLEIWGGTHNISGATFTGLGQFNLSNATLNLLGDADFPNLMMAGSAVVTGTNDLNIAGEFTFWGGELRNNGNVTIGADFEWFGGQIGKTDGLTYYMVTVNGTTEITNDVNHLLYSRHLLLSQGGNWVTGTLSLGEGAILRVPVGKTLEISSANPTVSNLPNSATSYFVIEGTMEKTSSGLLTFGDGAFFQNMGNVSLPNGKIKMLGGGTHTGDYYTVENSALQFEGGGHYFNGTSFSGPGTVLVSGGNIHLESDAALPFTTITAGGIFGPHNLAFSEDLTLNGGTIANGGGVSVSGDFDWGEGQIGGITAVLTSLMEVTGSTTFSQSSSNAEHRLGAGLTLRLNGGGTWGSGNMICGNNASIVVPSGRVLMLNAPNQTYMHYYVGATASLNVEGILIKQSPGVFTFTSGVSFNNSGNTLIWDGSIELKGGGTQSGTYVLIGNNRLEIDGGTFTAQSSLDFPANGSMLLNSGTIQMSGFGGAQLPELTMNGGQIGGIGTLTINGDFTINHGSVAPVGVVSVQGNLTLTNYDAYLENTAAVSVNGDLNWAGGKIAGSGTMTVAGQSFFYGSEHILQTKTLILNGGGTWSNEKISGKSQAVLRVPAGQTLLLTAPNDTRFAGDDLANRCTFDIQGTLEKSTPGDFWVETEVAFNNSGQVNISSGRLQLHGGGTFSGSFNLLGDNRLSLNSVLSHYTINGVNFTGGGDLHAHNSCFIDLTTNTVFPKTYLSTNAKIQGNFDLTVQGDLINDGGQIQNDGNLTVLGNFAMNNGGSVTENTGDITVSGAFTWNAGRIGASGNASGGTLSVAGLTSIYANGDHTFFSKTLEMNGGGTWSGGTLSCGYGAMLRVPVGNTLFMTMNNATEFKNNYGGDFSIFDNQGSIVKNDVGVFTVEGETVFSNSGTVEITAGQLLWRGGGTATGVFDLTGPNRLEFAYGTQPKTLNGATFPGSGSVKISGGTIQLNSMITFPEMTMTDGTLEGNYILTFADDLNFSGGKIKKENNVNVNGDFVWGGGEIGINGSAFHADFSVSGATTIINSGSHYLFAKTLNLNGGGIWENGDLFLTTNAFVHLPAGETFEVTATGDVKMEGSGSSNSFSNDGQFWRSHTGTTTFSNSVTVLNNGLLKGIGNLVFQGAFINEGIVSPGLSIGTLGMQYGGGIGAQIKILNIETAFGNWDKLNVTGNLAIASNSILYVSETPCLLNGTYPIITYTGTRTGTFTASNLPPGYAIEYDDAAKAVNLVYNDPPPIIVCPPNFTVTTGADLCEAVVANYGVPTVSDNCPGSSWFLTNVLPAYPVGVSTVIWIAEDSKGQMTSCPQTITVLDAQAPVVTCPADVSVTNDPGECSATLAADTATATDNCTLQSIVSDAPALFPVGTTIVTHTATDAGGLTAVCQQTVTVSDSENPSITCPPNITADVDSGMCAIALSLPNATVSDNCGLWGIDNDAPPVFAVGETVVNFTAIDLHGNTAICGMMVQVLDDEAPVFPNSCPEISLSNSPGICEAIFAMPLPDASDNCTPLPALVSDAPPAFPVGTTSVTWIATDAAGNTAACVQDVVVSDVEPPLVSCPPNITANVDAGQCHAILNLTATASDNCTVQSMDDDAPATFPLGTTLVHFVATDVNGNSGTCSLTATVLDVDADNDGFFSCANDCDDTNPAIYPGASESCANLLDDDCDGIVNETLTISVAALVNPGCPGASNGAIQITPNCGLPPFTYEWSNGAASQNLTNAPEGPYTVTVTDQQGATASLTANLVAQPSSFSVGFALVKPACPGDATGKITANPSPAGSGYLYEWNTGATTRILSDIPAGTYTVTVTKTASGCTQTGSANLTDPQPITLTGTTVNVTCFGLSNGKITASAAGGTGGKTYAWNTGATTNTVSNLTAGTYSVTATDSKGCTATATYLVSEPAQLRLEYTVETLSNGKFKVTLSASGGTPYTTSVLYRYCKVSATNTCSFGTTSVYTNLVAGTYTFRARDKNGCTASVAVTLPTMRPATGAARQLDVAPQELGAAVFAAQPNPFDSQCLLTTDQAPGTDCWAKFFADDGRLIAEKTWPAGQKSLALETADWPTGVVFCRINGADGQVLGQFKIVKQ